MKLLLLVAFVRAQIEKDLRPGKMKRDPLLEFDLGCSQAVFLGSHKHY